MKAVACCVLLIAGVAPSCLHAQTDSQAPTERQSPTPGPVGESAGAAESPTGLFAPSRSALLGDAFGLRTTLGEYGISLGLQETSEVFGNARGGVRRGIAYNGLTIVSLGLDTARAFGWDGGTFNVSAFQIHGRDLSGENLGSLQTTSGIEALRSTRLWELWYQQTLPGGQVDVKFGQQSLDEEFIGSSYAGTFINGAFGWPIVPTYALYDGGPAFPLSSLGARVRARPSGAVTVLAGVFDDNPAGGQYFSDSQVRGAAQSGTEFHLGTGALFIAEAQYAVNQPVEGDPGPEGAYRGLPGTYKLGGWYDTGSFPDQRFDPLGRSIADPKGTGNPRFRHHDFDLYGTVDQTAWQPDPQGAQSVGVFARVMGSPGDRNLVDFGLNAGLVLKAPLPGRDADSVGIGYGLATIGRNASLLSKDVAFFSGRPNPVRSSESFVEATYQYVVASWWQIQPDFQYVFTPGGGLRNPYQPGQRIGNEAVFGIRTNVTF